MTILGGSGGTMPPRHRTSRVITAAIAVALMLAPAGLAGATGATAAQDPPAPSTTTPAGSPAATDTSVPGATTTTPPGGATVPGTPTTTAPLNYTAPPIDSTSLTRLLAARRVAATALAQAAADAANMVAITAVATARDHLAQVQANVAGADSAVQAAEQAAAAAAAEVDGARRTLGAAVVESYQLANTSGDPVSARQGDMLNGLQRFDAYSHTTTYSQAALGSLQRRVREARDRLDQRTAELDTARASRHGLDDDVAAATDSLSGAERTAAAVAEAGTASVAKAQDLGQDLLAPGLEGPTVLGDSAVGAADMAAFAMARGRPDPSIDMTALAGYYLAEGQAEGVRGDIAFAQSILETGTFSFAGSKVHPTDNNYAGIGACDSCGGGTGYPTPELGVRAQVQLLRIYATKDLTTKDLGHPPAGRPPEKVGVRGCCDTWMRLSGKWATGTGYGVKILELYNQMLAFAAARTPSAP